MPARPERQRQFLFRGLQIEPAGRKPMPSDGRADRGQAARVADLQRSSRRAALAERQRLFCARHATLVTAVTLFAVPVGWPRAHLHYKNRVTGSLLRSCWKSKN